MLAAQATDPRHLSTLGTVSRTATGASPWIQRERIDDDERRGNAEPAQPGQEPRGFEARKLRGASHRDETGRITVAQQVLQPTNLAGQFDEIRGERPGPDNLSIFEQHAQQRLHPVARHGWHFEQPQSMPGRRGVDDDGVVGATRLDHGQDTQ